MLFYRYLPKGKAAGFSIVTIKMMTGVSPDMDGIKAVSLQSQLLAFVLVSTTIFFFKKTILKYNHIIKNSHLCYTVLDTHFIHSILYLL